MEPETNKNKALTKEETAWLLTIIEGSKIINNKKTNATNNKMKVEEWVRIANTFNANMGTCRRTPQQLRLKWENLKKNSRKRSTLIRMERIKTGGGPPGYIPHDEILDRVAALLGSTGEGLTVMFGGDAEPQIIGDGDGGGSDGTVHIMPAHSHKSPSPMILLDSSLPVTMENPSYISIDYPSLSIENPKPMGNEMPNNSIGDELKLGNTSTPIVPKQKRHFTSSGAKRKLLKPDDGRQARNDALTEYYTIKRKLLESKFENIMLENEKLKLEIRKLKGEDIN